VVSTRIAVLPPDVADQIAAGEVVERPASVVKELVENALDAGAQRIEVTLEDGGRRMVRVADDGEGMDRESAQVAVQRHATSKIRSLTDLIGIGSLGFRGEALAAIASVSRFELETAPAGGEGTRLTASAGRLDAVEPCSRRAGTTVTVRELFHNTPARRKFLRASRTEQRAAAEVVTTLALARPDVGFRLVSQGKVLFDAGPQEGLDARVANAWSRRLAETLVPVAHRDGPLEVRGLVQRPADASPAGRRALLFVNGRPVRDFLVLRAAEAAYATTVAPGNRPSLLLFLELPGDGVDVNVHPAKLEVRFRDRYWVERVVGSAVRHALGDLVAAAPASTGPASELAGVVPWLAGERADSSSSAPMPEWGAAPLETQASLLPEGAEPGAVGPPAVLQVFHTFIVFATDAEIVVVDQHSAHERVLFERTLRTLTGEGAPGQRLLMPLTLELAPAELEAVEEHRQQLAQLGYEVEPFGGSTIVAHSVPNPHPRFDAGLCLNEMAADLARGRFGAWPNRLERFAATYACRAAVKAGQRLDDRAMHDLLEALFTTDLPPHDVHGRPTIVRLPRVELERRFGRR
jgi:DNA mismatch repair protein MutL